MEARPGREARKAARANDRGDAASSVSWAADVGAAAPREFTLENTVQTVELATLRD
jgi:hypothetical protein